MEEKLFFPYDREIKIDNTQDGSHIFFKKKNNSLHKPGCLICNVLLHHRMLLWFT